jgi:polyisoprenoid-binding protein YceI
MEVVGHYAGRRVGRFASLQEALRRQLRAWRTGLFAAALLLSPLTGRGDDKPFILDRAESHVDVTAKATLGSFTARLAEFNAVIKVDAAEGHVTSAQFGAELSAVKTGIADRDRNMMAWLQSAAFPEVSFELSGLDRAPDGALRARGLLRLHGQQHEICFPLAVSLDHGIETFDGSVELDTRDYGLPIIRFFVLTVDPVLEVRFHLQGTLSR